MKEELLLTFEDIVHELSDRLFMYLKNMVGNSESADDLLQETLITITVNPLFLKTTCY